MIKSVNLGEEIIITTKNKIGLMANVSAMLAKHDINIEATAGYEDGKTAKLLLVTNANLLIVNDLKRKKYKSVREVEVVIVTLENKPGTLKAVTGELRKARIDIKHMYVTGSLQGASRMVLLTSDNEKAMAVLIKLVL